MITRKQALQIIANIEQCNGYKESDGDLWLGPRLYELRTFIDGLPIGVASTPETVRAKMRRGQSFADACANVIEEND